MELPENSKWSIFLKRHAQAPILRKLHFVTLRDVHSVLDNYRDRRKERKNSILIALTSFSSSLPRFMY